MIAFDIDGCFLDVMPRMRQELSLRSYKVISGENDYWVKTAPSIEDHEWTNLWEHVFLDFKSTKPYDGAVDFMMELYGKTQKPIYFITSRNARHATSTYRAIRHYLKVPFTVAFANRPFRKVDYMQNCRWIVEDNPEEIMMLNANGYQVIMPERPWNKKIQELNNNPMSTIRIPTFEIGQLSRHIIMFTEANK